MRRAFAVWILVLLCMILALSGCGRGKGPAGPPTVPVRVAQAEKRDIPVTVGGVGLVEPYNSVTVYSRVTGQVLKLHFKEGQEMKEGDPLFSIDPAPFQERLNSAQGKLARDEASLVFVQSEANRYRGLLDLNAVSKSEAEKAINSESVLKEVIRADKADMEQAKLDLGYCEIRSPVTGRTGAYLANEGTFVEAYKTNLVVVNQIRPIYATFSIPEAQLPAVKAAAAKKPLEVTATPSGGTAVGGGSLTFIDNTVDKRTGMIKLKGEFPNEDAALWPGQFVDVSVTLATLTGVVVVPSDAVLSTEIGLQVFVVGQGDAVELRKVEIGEEHKGFTVIKSGVSAGETLVTDGMNKLRPGFKAKVAQP